MYLSMLRNCSRFFLLFAIVCFSSASLFSQTAFDSLKRNSNLDTSYHPSDKPTITTEFSQMKISGFIQPVLYIDNNNVFNNDVFITSEIPTTQITDVKFRRFHISANQSRLGFSFKFPKAGKNVSSFLEADFFSSQKGANTFFRLRHAYITYGEFTIGQTWTNFGDVNGSPNTLDLEGPNSMPGSRVPQIRWTHALKNNWSLIVAAEEPKADYTPLPGASAVKSALPEFVFKPTYSFKNVTWVNSVVYRQMVYTDSKYSFKKTLPGWGVTTSLTLNLKDNQKFNPFGIKKRTVNIFFIIGKGTQGSVNDFGGLSYEAFPKDSVTLAMPLYYGGYASYSFVWNKRWSSTLVYSYLHQEQPPNIDQIFKVSHYFAANGVYAINKYFTLGGEVLYGIKADYDDTKGSALRVMGLMRLIF